MIGQGHCDMVYVYFRLFLVLFTSCFCVYIHTGHIKANKKNLRQMMMSISHTKCAQLVDEKKSLQFCCLMYSLFVGKQYRSKMNIFKK